jgi:threonine dehydratase
MEKGNLTNGDANINGIAHTNGSRPRTPSLNTFSLTEYSANPSPPSIDPRSKIRGVVPDEFLLPNGYPDVGRPSFGNY